ncbi:hypothetical protein GCM10028818_40680 [Spirosoma horti]
MENASKIFTKGERELLYDILTGQAVGTKGVKISCFRRKIEEKLTLMGKKVPEKMALNLIIYRKGNKQDIWLAAYQVCEEERPGIFDTLQKELESPELATS